MAKKKSKVVQAEVMDDSQDTQSETKPGKGNQVLRSLLGKATADKVEAARAKVREQFQTQLAEAQQRLQGLEKRAHDLVASVQSSASAAVDKVREEKDDVVHRIEEAAHDLGAKVPDKLGVEQWLKMPAEAREDLLTALGVASQKQMVTLHEELAALRAELAGQLEAQTEILAGLHDDGDDEAKPKKRVRAAIRKAAEA